MAVPFVSFEFFPPKTQAMEEQVWQSLARLEPLAPSFVSVTYGAGGSTRDRTHTLVERIHQETSLTPAAHLTCIASSKEDIDAIAQRYWNGGIRHIVALRGDMPQEDAEATKNGDYRYASELVTALKKIADFEISVAAYPEVHPEALSSQDDLDNLKRKYDAGATRAISQFFFETDHFLRFRDCVARQKIDMDLVAGILPVTNVQKILSFARKSGTLIPSWLPVMFEGLDDDPATRRLVAAHLAATQCDRLQQEGVSHFHFYTLNRSELSFAICHLLGLRARRHD